MSSSIACARPRNVTTRSRCQMAWEESWLSALVATGQIGRKKYVSKVRIAFFGIIYHTGFFDSMPFVSGNELRWRFTSDGSVNGWGWRFTVYPVISAGTHSNSFVRQQGLADTLLNKCSRCSSEWGHAKRAITISSPFDIGRCLLARRRHGVSLPPNLHDQAAVCLPFGRCSSRMCTAQQLE